MGHARTGEFSNEAVKYRQSFIKALGDKCRHMPKWTDSDGHTHRLEPTTLTLKGKNGEKEEKYENRRSSSMMLALPLARLAVLDDETNHAVIWN